MKRDLILLVNANPDTARLIESIASTRQCDLRFTASATADSHLEETLTGVTLIVLDADDGVDEGSLSPRVVTCATTLPVIVVSKEDKSWLEPILGTDRPQHYLRKPVSVKQLNRLVDKVLGHGDDKSCRCDRWGHPCQECARRTSGSEAHQIVAFLEH